MKNKGLDWESGLTVTGISSSWRIKVAKMQPWTPESIVAHAEITRVEADAAACVVEERPV